MDIVVLRDVSRLGRDTVETLESYRAVRNSGVCVIFDENGLDTELDSNEFILSVFEAVYQAENESRSQNIKIGMQQKAQDGTSGFYHRKCYGYQKNREGRLVPNVDEAKVVQQIFDWYLEGKSVLGIVKALEKNGVSTPSRKTKWPKRTVDVLLSNEKYIGDVRLKGASPEEDFYYLNNHEPIIRREVFDAVQDEKARRSNVLQQGDEVKRTEKNKVQGLIK